MHYPHSVEGLIARHGLAWAGELLSTFPALVIEGARQVGKSTFAHTLVNGTPALEVTLDDEETLVAALADPRQFVEQAPDRTLVIDEVERAPELILPVKAAIDRDRRPGRFVLTGSADLLRLERTPDSLAGRAHTVRLRSLSQGEILGRVERFVDSFVSQFIDGDARPQDFTTTGSIAGILDIEVDGSLATIDTIAVHPDHAQRGIASALLSAALPRVQGLGATELDAWTREDAAANAWYRRSGFTERFRYLHVYKGWEDAADGFAVPDGVGPLVTAFLHAPIEREAEMRARFARVHTCRRYVRPL